MRLVHVNNKIVQDFLHNKEKLSAQVKELTIEGKILKRDPVSFRAVYSDQLV